MIHHAGKQKGGDHRYIRDQDQILGSVALQGFSATQMHFTPPELNGTHQHVLSITPHHAPRERHGFKFKTDGSGLEWTGLIADETAETQSVIRDSYLEWMGDDGRETTDMLEWAKKTYAHQRARAYEIMLSLKKEGQAVQPRRGTWARARIY